MKQISIFKNPNFGEIRTAVDENGNILFCLKDVCNALGIQNSRNVMRTLHPKGVHSIDTLTDGGVQKLTFVNEPNLYRCIFQSRKKINEIALINFKALILKSHENFVYLKHH